MHIPSGSAPEGEGDPPNQTGGIPPVAAPPPDKALRVDAVRRNWVFFWIVVAISTGLGGLLLGFRGQLTDAYHKNLGSSPDWVRHAAAVAGTAVLVYGLTRLLKPSFRHLNAYALTYPPVWCAVALAWVILCAIDLGELIGPAEVHRSVIQWVGYTVASGVLVWCLQWVGKSAPETGSPGKVEAPDRHIDEVLSDPAALRAWYESEGHAEEDMLGTRRIARRLARYLGEGMDRPRTVGIVGGFGSGKTSIVRWLKWEVERPAPAGRGMAWLCEVSCWGFEDSALATEYILKKAVAKVGEHLDCFSFRGLPEAYRKTFAAGGDWVRNLIDLVLGSTDPLEQFERLSQRLAFVNARLVIVIEDLDRTPSAKFDRGEVLALLERLRQYPSLSFILTGGASRATGFDFARLCERIELVQALPSRQTLRIISAFRQQQILSYPHDAVTTALNPNPWHRVTQAVLIGDAENELGEAMCRLVTTPRALKLVIRHVSHAWAALHGEVDFDHLLAVNSLRHAAPETINFLAEHEAELLRGLSAWRHDRERLPAVRERFLAAWAAATAGVDWDADAALDILLYVLPQAAEFFREQRSHEGQPAQGVGNRNYLQRILHEEIGADELRDQEVLTAAGNWLQAPAPDSPFVARLRGSEDFSDAWEHFARRGYFGFDRIYDLATQLFSSFAAPEGSRPDGAETHPAFLSLWRIAHHHVPRRTEGREWIECRLAEAMSRSLALANDIYYYWASVRYGVIAPGTRWQVRDMVCDRARTQIDSGDALLRIVHPTFHYDLYLLVFPATDDAPEPEPEGRSEDWTWLAPILRAALVTRPEVMAPKVAYLICEQGGDPFQGFSQRVNVGHLVRIFPEGGASMVELLVAARPHLAPAEQRLVDQVVGSMPVPEAHTSPPPTAAS